MCDLQPAEFKYKKPFAFRNYAKLIFSCKQKKRYSRLVKKDNDELTEEALKKKIDNLMDEEVKKIVERSKEVEQKELDEILSRIDFHVS